MAGYDLTLSVSKLNDYVNSLLTNDVRLRSIKVEGEISSMKLQYGSGHLYFTLKDANASIRCVMFKSRAASLKFEPRDGSKVIVSGKVEIYSPSGQYSFNVNSMHEVGEGDIFKQFLEMRDKLNAEGLFDQKRSIPKIPKCVGIITSESGAALHDILNVISRRFPHMDIVFSPALVQGKDAPQSLIAALDALNCDKRADVIIIGRGGGSYDELSCFNDEALARAIYSSEIPTISAVGHEIDYTIADFAADLRAPTPSAAAELCVPVYDELTGTIKGIGEQLTAFIRNAYSIAAKHIEYCRSSTIMRDPDAMLEARRQKLFDMRNSIEHSYELSFASKCATLESRMLSLEALNPCAVLSRGYALIRDERDHYIDSLSNLNKGCCINIVMKDGEAAARILDTVKNTK